MTASSIGGSIAIGLFCIGTVAFFFWIHWFIPEPGNKTKNIQHGKTFMKNLKSRTTLLGIAWIVNLTVSLLLRDIELQNQRFEASQL